MRTQPRPPDLTLPPLREDLEVVPAVPAKDGAPTWTIIDPIRNKHFQIGWAAHQLLSRWSCGTAKRLIERVAAETTCQPTREDIEELVKFLYANNLTRESPTGSSRAFADQAQARRQRWLTWLVHNYLFIRIPLVRPDRFLNATLPLVEPLFTKTARRLVILVGVIGLYLAGSQWESFVNTFLYFFSWTGLISYALAIGIVKILHELGHAYTAKRYGCHVPTMGVAFLVLFPVLYTDATEAWRLRSRRQRLLIGAAGTITELSLAALATFLWNFLPDGVLRSVTFLVATSSWIMGLMVNLNPFLRFDGYYMLSDWLRVPNLQERAFALGRWRLRELLFGTGEPPPEQTTASLRHKLVIYAWAVWVYRFFLFLGIALLVYFLFFKVLGVLLFVVEILWFIVFPVAREFKEWWKIKGTIAGAHRVWVSGGIFIVLVALLVIPLPTRVAVPAVLEATPHATLFAPAPGRIVTVGVKEGQRVTQGDVLLTLEAPSIEKDIALITKRIEVLRLRARRQAASPEELAANQVTIRALHSRLSQLQGLLDKRDNLSLRAPISGVVTDLADSLHVGRWVNKELSIAFVVDTEGKALHALAPEIEVARLEVGQAAWFIPDDAARRTVQARVQEIREIDEGAFDVPYLASIFGGEIPVRTDASGKLRPQASVYRVQLVIVGPAPSWNQAVKGELHVDGRRWSLAGRLWDRVAMVLIRESGF